MLPHRGVTIYPESFPVLESDVALPAFARIPGLIATELRWFDIVDVLNVRRTNTGAIGGTLYTRRPDLSDPRYVLDWFIYAIAANAMPAPGALTIMGASLDVATGNLNANVADFHLLASIPYTGPPAFVPGLWGGNPAIRYLHGSLRLESRAIAIFYENGAVDQTAFHLGTYLRPS